MVPAARKTAGWLFLIVCCLLPVSLSTPISSAQDAGSKIIFISGEINEYNQGDTDFGPGRSNFSLAFFATLRDILVSEGFEPVFVTASSDEHYPDFFEPAGNYEDIPNFWKQVLVAGPTSYGEEDWVRLTQYAGYQFPGLPMGTFGMTIMPRISVARFASLQEVARLAAGLALYTSHHCDAALPYLVEASNNEALMEDGILVYGGTMFYRASCEYDQGLIEDAAASYQAVIDYPYESQDYDLRLFSLDAATNLAWINAQRGKQEEAIALLDLYQAIDYHSAFSQRDMERFLKRADVYLALGANDFAIAEVTSLIEIAEQDPVEFWPDVMARLYTERGQHYLQTGQLTQALADFNQGIEIDAEYPKAYYWRGMLHTKREDFSQSKADFIQFLALAPDYYNYYEDDLTPYIEQATTSLEILNKDTEPTPSLTP